MDLNFTIGNGLFILLFCIILTLYFIPMGFYFKYYDEFEKDYDDLSSSNKDTLNKFHDAFAKNFGLVIVLTILIVSLIAFIYFFQIKVEETLSIAIFTILLVSFLVVSFLILSNVFVCFSTLSDINSTDLVSVTQTETKKLLKDGGFSIGLATICSIICIVFSLFLGLVYLMLRNNPFVETKTTRRRLVRKTLLK